MIALLRPDRFLLLAGLLFGAAFAIVTPPFEVPDEPAHFARAYRVSEGWLDLVPQPGRTGAPLPASVQRITTGLVAGIPFHPERKISPAAIRAALEIPLEPAKRVPVFFPSGLQYTFVPYIPQALGIAAGRLCGAPPLVHPLRFLGVVAVDYVVHAPRYLSELVGNLGWLDTPLPREWVVVYLALLLALVVLDTGPADSGIDVRPWQRGVIAAAAWALHGRRWAGSVPLESLGLPLAAFSLLSFGIALWTLVARYYGG